MSIEKFDRYTLYPEARLREFGVPDEQMTFLTSIGLPTWCAPNIHFGDVGESWTLLPYMEVDGKGHLALGEDRDDRPIVLSLDDHSVLVLNASECSMLVSSNIAVLSEALARFQACINAAVELDSQAYTDNRIPPELFEPFVSWLHATDPMAIKTGSFWQAVLHWLGVPASAFSPIYTNT